MHRHVLSFAQCLALAIRGGHGEKNPKHLLLCSPSSWVHMPGYQLSPGAASLSPCAGCSPPRRHLLPRRRRRGDGAICINESAGPT